MTVSNKIGQAIGDYEIGGKAVTDWAADGLYYTEDTLKKGFTAAIKLQQLRQEHYRQVVQDAFDVSKYGLGD
jgi:hypothetical protein